MSVDVSYRPFGGQWADLAGSLVIPYTSFGSETIDGYGYAMQFDLRLTPATAGHARPGPTPIKVGSPLVKVFGQYQLGEWFEWGEDFVWDGPIPPSGLYLIAQFRRPMDSQILNLVDAIGYPISGFAETALPNEWYLTDLRGLIEGVESRLISPRNAGSEVSKLTLPTVSGATNDARISTRWRPGSSGSWIQGSPTNVTTPYNGHTASAMITIPTTTTIPEGESLWVDVEVYNDSGVAERVSWRSPESDGTAQIVAGNTGVHFMSLFVDRISSDVLEYAFDIGGDRVYISPDSFPLF